ncbi:MAG: response regulator [Verrucomicrobia bacterium]|nr:MAG: response regulator [Verrucomicrobiota bacterium]
MPARVLIIEDNLANLELMTYLLVAFGHVPLTTQNGEEGLAAARRETPDVIVCDIQLPGIDGYSVARQIKAEAALRAIPVVAVTALAMVGDREKALASGFDGYVSKPIDPETFVAHVESFLRPEQRSSRVMPEASAAAALPPKNRQVTVLAVDDQSVNLILKRSILEPLGFVVLTADGMAEALRLARKTPPDLIISDMNMADGNGFDFIKAVKADPRLKEIPFVFVTSTYCDEASRAKGLALGAQRFLFRPIEPEVLVAELEASLSEAKARQL